MQTKKYHGIFILSACFALFSPPIIKAVGQGAPDLSISITECPRVVEAGDSLKGKLKISIGDLGREPGRNFFVDIVLSTDRNIPVGPAHYSPSFQEDVRLKGGRIHVDTLHSQGSQWVELDIPGDLQIPIDTPAGKYFIGAIADSKNDLRENSEDNNVAISKIRVKCDHLRRIDSCDIIGSSQDPPVMSISWNYTGPPEGGESFAITGLPIKLWVQRIVDPLTDTPITSGPFEVRPVTTARSCDVPVKSSTYLHHGGYKIVFKAVYSCSREKTFTFSVIY